jgi:hypothetical protein
MSSTLTPPSGSTPIGPYGPRPEQIDTWIKASHLALPMCGNSGDQQRAIREREIRTLGGLVCGVCPAWDEKVGDRLSDWPLCLAAPLQRGQVSGREVMRGQVVIKACPKDAALMADRVATSCACDEKLREQIYGGGVRAASDRESHGIPEEV